MATKRRAATARKAAKTGRPTSYRPEYADQARRLTLLGLTIPRLAEFFGKGETTIDRWMAAHPEFRAAIKDARQPADGQVADAMFRNACGFEWEEEQAIKVKTGPHTEKVEIVTVKRRQPPNVVAGIFILCNRHPELWKRTPPPDAGDDKAPPASVPVKRVDASVPEPGAA